jgi:beta-glucosidase/6-phospho-beta-glucosidase/beta-galactosidase
MSQGEKQASPWKCTYHVLLAHAAAVKAFRQHVPGGRISLNINGDWSQPLTNSPADKVCPALPLLGSPSGSAYEHIEC